MLSSPARDLVMLALRRSAQGPGLAAVRVGYAVAVFVPAALTAPLTITSEAEYELVGRTLFLVQAALGAFVASVVVPAMVAQSLGEEARAGRLGLVVLSGRRSHRVVEGLVAGEVLAIAGVAAAGIPVGLATSALGGVRAAEVAVVVGVTITMAAVGASMGALMGLSDSPSPTALAVSGSVATILGAGAFSWQLSRYLGAYAIVVGCGAALLSSSILIRLAARRLDVVGTSRTRPSGGAPPVRPATSPAAAPQTRSVPELWPLVEPETHLVETTWVAAGLAASAALCAAVAIAGAAQSAIDVTALENAIASVGAVGVLASLMLATWYPALRIGTLVEPKTLALVAVTTQRARSVLGAMQASAVTLSSGIAAAALLLLLPATIRRAPSWSSIVPATIVLASLQFFLLAAATLIAVDAPSVRRALGSATLLLVLGLTIWGAFWSPLLSGRGISSAAAVALSALLGFLATLAWSQARHMFVGRWREPLGDLWRLRFF